MNAYHRYTIISIATFMSGILFFALSYQWIIFSPPWQKNVLDLSSDTIQKKQIIFHYFHGDKWKTEKQEMLWQDNIEKDVFHIVSAWLALLEEEHIMGKKIMLQSVLVTPSGTIYLSFDRAILNKEETIFKKWMLIEGLLKTIASTNLNVTHVQFLIQHQQVQDTHIDFSLSWPVHGFIT